MSFSTKTNDRCSMNSETQSLATEFLNLNCLTTEIIKNNKNSSELELIYLEESLILQIKRKHQTIKSYSCHFDPKVVKRIKSAWEWEAEDELIAIARMSQDTLFVLGCDLNTWEIPFKLIPLLDEIPVTEKYNFEIDEDGSYLYWKSADLHLDLEDLKAAVDPEFKAKLLLEKLNYGKLLGGAIFQVRKIHQLNQNEIDGISARHLRRIENEGHQPTLEALKKLARAHELSLEDYLTAINQQISKIGSEP